MAQFMLNPPTTAVEANFPGGRPSDLPGDETLTMPQPLNIEQIKADAEAEASAFQSTLGHLVSRYVRIMQNEYDPEMDPDVSAKQELKRLNQFGAELVHCIKQLDTVHMGLVEEHAAYHKYGHALPNEGRVRAAFMADLNRFMQEHDVSQSIKGATKRIDELKAVFKQTEANHRQLKLVIPENQLDFESESESEYTEDSHDVRQPKASYEATSSRRTSKVPSGATSSKQKAATTHTRGKQQPPSHARSSEQPRQHDKSSSEFGHASSHAAHGPSEPPVGAPGESTGIYGQFRSMFLNTAPKTSPPARSGSPLKFSADGKRRTTTSDGEKLYDKAVKTGADFSAYNNNPFYLNSSVKLPIRPTECVPSGTDKYPAPVPLSFKGITDTPFTGDIRSYNSWRDAFIRLVHAPGRIMQDSERLLYLKQCLKGPPLELVERVPINDYGYHFATRQLEARFYNPKRALFTLRQDLQDIRAPANTYNDLLRFQQDLLHICGNFLNAGEDINLNDFCFDIVMRKLPFTVRCTLSQRKRDQGDTSPWTISQLLEELQGALDVMSDAYLYEAPQQPSGSRPRPSRRLALDLADLDHLMNLGYN